ncbi:hypothetical protein ACF0H5_003287 [Mactra antiquata]
MAVINWISFWLVLHLLNGCYGGRLYTSGKNFMKDGHRVFLSGTNLAWVNYARDFGNNQYNNVKAQMERYLSEIHAAGGNSIRVWVHIEGETSPHFLSNGYVDKTDAGRSLINDMRNFLHAAQARNVLVFFTLWNGAVKQNTHWRLNGLIKDTGKLQSYINIALIPMVNALKGEPALGGWDIINEAEGVIIPGHQSSNPCHDTTSLTNSGAGWAGQLYTAAELQRFVNWQADAIRTADPGAMVTVGAWNAKADAGILGFHNLYSDHCLVSSGGKAHGTLTFFQVHTYAYQGKFDGLSPFEHHGNDYNLNKPIVIGEFREEGGRSISDMYNHAYYYGYSGAWGWQAIDNNWSNLQTGMRHLKGRNDQQKGGMVAFSV